MEVR
jgi:hypothetical protein